MLELQPGWILVRIGWSCWARFGTDVGSWGPSSGSQKSKFTSPHYYDFQNYMNFCCLFIFLVIFSFFCVLGIVCFTHTVIFDFRVPDGAQNDRRRLLPMAPEGPDDASLLLYLERIKKNCVFFRILGTKIFFQNAGPKKKGLTRALYMS